MPPETKPLGQTQSKPFDLEQALNHMDGDQELFQTLVTIFIDESVSQMEQIRKGIQRADAGMVEKAAHTIKGTVGNFAASRTVELASRLEILGRESRLSEMPKAFAELEQELEALKNALQNAIA